MATVFNVPVASLMLPKVYVRKKRNLAYVEELRDKAKDAGKWPFPPIEVSGLYKAVKGKKYQIVDGVHRTLAAQLLKIKAIPAVSITLPEEPGQLFWRQFTSNESHGLRVDRDHRDRAILLLLSKRFKLNQVQVAAMTGLTQSSISKIKAGVQRQTPEKKAAKKEAKEKAPKGFNPVAFFDAIAFHNGAFTDYRALILAHFQKHAKDLGGVVDRCRANMVEIQLTG